MSNNHDHEPQAAELIDNHEEDEVRELEQRLTEAKARLTAKRGAGQTQTTTTATQFNGLFADQRFCS
jgi:hypothetical protein